MTTIYKFKVGFTKLGIGTAPASAPTITISDGTNTLVSSGAMSTTPLAGEYRYSYSGADDLDLTAIVATTDLTMDAPNLFATPQVTPADVWSYASRTLSAFGFSVTVGTNNDKTGYALTVTPPTAADIWSHGTRTITSGMITAAQIWDALLTSITMSGSIGKLIKDLLDAAISSRATPADVTAFVSIGTVEAAQLQAGVLSLRTSYTFREAVASIVTGDLSTAKIWFAIKRAANMADDDAVIFMDTASGLTVVNGAAYTSTTHGAITVSGMAGAWEIGIEIDQAATNLLAQQYGCVFEVKALINGDADLIASGILHIVTGAIKELS